MPLSPSLRTRTSRTLAMTAQLRQAIGLVQFNNSQLETFLAEQAAENPFLILHRPAPRPVPAPATGPAHDFDTLTDRIAAPQESLSAYVTRQIDAMFAVPTDRHIAITFTATLEPYGWLGAPVEEIAAQAGVSEPEALAILDRLQTMEPAGLFARSLSECLRLQAKSEEVLDPVMDAILSHLGLAASGSIDELARISGASPDAVIERLKQIRGFNPKPGAAFADDTAPLRPPDLVTKQSGGTWTVSLNNSTLPTLSLDETRIAAADRREALVAEAIAAAQGLKRALEQRNANTLAVSAEVVRHQARVMDNPKTPLRALTMQAVGKTVGLSESTVSRVVNGLTIETPAGVRPLRAYFSRPAPMTGDQDPVSVSEIRHRIRGMIAAEEPLKPLSDIVLTERLNADGIAVQRRTVAKYRSELGIPTAPARKRKAVATD